MARYLSSECTEEERVGVEKWIGSSSENRHSFETLKKIWGLSGQKAEEWRSGRSITSFRLRLKTAESGLRNNRGGTVRLYKIVPRKKAAVIHSISRVLSAAAVILLVVGTVYLATLLKEFAQERKTSEEKPVVSYEQISTRPGQRITLTFADGTRILLNSASSLRYADVPDGKREFFLSGEAFFEVVHSDRRPLIVKTDDAVIRDMGTKFDVESWPGDRRTRVAVAEGEVTLSAKSQAGSQSATVTRGRYSVVMDGKIAVPPSYTDIGENLAWLKGFLLFRNEPIAGVFKQLRRKYGLHCSASDPSILSRTITATFTGEQTPDEILKIIALSLNVNYRSSRDSVQFVLRKPFLRRNKTN